MRRKLIELKQQRAAQLEAAETALKAGKQEDYNSSMEQIRNMNTEIKSIQDLIEEQDCAYTLTHFGYIKRQPTSVYRAQRRGGRGGIDLRAQVFRGKNRHSPSPPFLSGVTAIIAHPLKERNAADEDRPLRGGGQSMRAFYQR